MPTAGDILWFKKNFQDRVRAGIAGTPLTLDFITALACQETGEVWPVLRRNGLSVKRILELCVGDSLDADKGRSALPRNKSELLAEANGAQMFQIGHDALVEMAQYVDSYKGAARLAHKFCRGYGIFQLDLQFFKTKPGYFLNREYVSFDASFRECMIELRSALRRQGYAQRAELTDEELAEIGIVSNTGRFNPKKGLRQGYEVDGKFYGQFLFDYIRLARTVAVGSEAPSIEKPMAGQAILGPTGASEAAEPTKLVKTPGLTLRIRSQPNRSRPTNGNVTAELPEGHPVAVVGRGSGRFAEIETAVGEEVFRGFASKNFLTPGAPQVLPGFAPRSLPEASLRIKPGVLITRREKLDAFSLNEPNQPGRSGTAPAELRAELAAIIEWLAVDRPTHLRYQKDTYTYCNIYCHDFCHLAGVYMPRVWWTATALVAIAQGSTVKAEYERTVTEVRANGLFRWLTEFGAAFGWRRSATLGDLQTAANQGAVALIIARNKREGPPGHVAMVVPESDRMAAIRNSHGEVVAPVQSQAGSNNFQYGTGGREWWKGERFAESAFWVHA